MLPFPLAAPAHELDGQLVVHLLPASVEGDQASVLYGRHPRTVASLGATHPAVGVSAARVFAAEGIVTFILVLVIISVATESKVPRGVGALSIGAALAAAIIIGGPVSGAGFNPARAIGPMILAGRFTDWWAYLAAPLIGGNLAVTLYDRILRPGSR